MTFDGTVSREDVSVAAMTLDSLAMALHKTRADNDAPEYDLAVAKVRAAKMLLSMPAAASERERIAREERAAIRAELNGWMLSVTEDHVRQRVLAILDSRDESASRPEKEGT